MSATVKQRMVNDSAALDLWRVAETDDVEELERILPRGCHINARNKHGMTALMRASHHGHERMVKALLDHGADPNLTRNDKFTALALAAFFGHTETVRILIDHGAKTEIVTRCNTSAYMWATARTFDDAARCLKSDVRAPAAVQPAVVKTLKTLKDPPEIWNLVHEVPRGFNPRSAFVSRLKSMKASLALRIAAVLVIGGACVVGALVLRDSQAHSLPAEIPRNEAVKEIKVSPPPVVASETVSNDQVVAPAPEVNVKRNSSRKLPFVRRQPEPVAAVVNENVEKSEVTPAPPIVASPKIESRGSNKVNTPVSPQLITPAKSSPPKAKVIQWP